MMREPTPTLEEIADRLKSAEGPALGTPSIWKGRYARDVRFLLERVGRESQ